MKILDPKEVTIPEFHKHFLGVVAPRPIAFASTTDRLGNINLSPFSYFNVFSSNPPILVFSPSSRVRDNSSKHTLDNVKEHPEVVINIANYSMVEQMSLASTEYEKGVNEFNKSGLTPVPSLRVTPPRVKEAPAAFECKVNQIIKLGNEGGAGNLVICEVILAYYAEEILDEKTGINPYKLDAVARMGANYYCRANEASIFEIPKPNQKIGMGVDQIPEAIRNSKILTGNNLGRLGNVEHLPDQTLIEAVAQDPEVADLLKAYRDNPRQLLEKLHRLAQRYLDEGAVEKGWCVLLQGQNTEQ